MKSTVALCLIGSALAAPTKTIQSVSLEIMDRSRAVAWVPWRLSSRDSLPWSPIYPAPLPPGLESAKRPQPWGASSGLSELGPKAKRQASGTTAKDVTDKVACQPLTFIFARGSDELGSMGTVVGPPQCPDTKVVLGGYSHGSMVVHDAVNGLKADQIATAVLFGDPFKAMSVGDLASSHIKEFCATGDPVCENGANVLAHVSYGSDASTAAQFLVEKSG
ncbi:uncharacterized protein N7459_001505, partial [Penicillium hispanicum]|uniref:uncharacterized protein n=1 Tax=Penicillium hispanicum TaxID=1080232 RepID=UPI00253FF562